MKRGPLGAIGCLLVAWAAQAGDARASADDAVASAQTDLASVGSGLDRVQAAVLQAKGERLTAEQRLANGELLFRMKDYNRAIGRPQRDPRGVPQHAELSRRAVAPRRDVLRAARLPRRAPRLPRDRRSRQRAPLPDVLRQGARAARRRVAAPERSARDAGAASSRSSTRCRRPRSTRRCSTRRARAYYRQGSWNDATARVLAGRTTRTDYTHQARYFQGLVAMKVARAPGPRRRRRRKTPPRRELHAGDRRLPRRHRAAAGHARAPARHRSGVDGDRPSLLRDGAVPAGGRGVLEGRPRQPRVRHDALRARVGVRAPRRRRSAPSARSRCSPVADPNSEYIGDGTLLRADLLLRAGRLRPRAAALRRRPHAVRADAREGRVVPRFDEGRERLLRQARAAAARSPRPERAAPADRRALGARGRGRTAGLRRHRRRQRVQDAHPRSSDQLVDKLTALMVAPTVSARSPSSRPARRRRWRSSTAVARAAHARARARRRGAGRSLRRDRARSGSSAAR